MFRVLFLFLILTGSVAFAQNNNQTPSDSLPEAIKVDEFEKATNGNVKMRMDAFYVELNNNPNATGYIITYGTPREIAKREKQIRVALTFRKYDISRVVFVNGGSRNVIKTEFWIVPAGAEQPKP